MIDNCQTVQDFDQLVSSSCERPVFLFKHSTRCPISAGRWREFQAFAEAEQRARFCRVLVIEDRPLSQYVARETGVSHQSPQVILISDCRAVWNTSHYSITSAAMNSALEQAISS